MGNRGGERSVLRKHARRGSKDVEGDVQNHVDVRSEAAIPGSQRSGGAIHGGPQVRRRGVQSAGADERHHHQRRRRDQPPAERGQRVLEARLRAAADSEGSRRRRAVKVTSYGAVFLSRGTREGLSNLITKASASLQCYYGAFRWMND